MRFDSSLSRTDSGKQGVEPELHDHEGYRPEAVVTPPTLIRRVSHDLFPGNQKYRKGNADKENRSGKICPPDGKISGIHDGTPGGRGLLPAVFR